MKYHITPQRNISGILQQGLKPNGGLGFTNRLVSLSDVYLTDDVQFICDTQLTLGWIERNKPVVLQVDTTNLFYIAVFEHEFCCPAVIEPVRLTIMDFL